MELVWHFMAEGSDGKPILRDGTPLEIGKWYEHTGPMRMCESGYHASIRAFDALGYAPGHWVALCEVDGEIEYGDDKIVARKRRALWAFNAEGVLRLFARQVALMVVHLWDCPPIVREYLETGREEIRAATSAAVRDATRAATWAATWAATSAAAEDAARAAARAATWAATWAATSAAAIEDANNMLEGMLLAEGYAE